MTDVWSRRRGAGGVLALLLLASALAHAEEATIQGIRVEGNRAIGLDTILYKLASQKGQPLSAETVRRDVRALYATGFFDDVQVRSDPVPGGVLLVFEVKERPVVRQVAISGNKKLGTATLAEKVTLQEGDVYDPVKIQESLAAVRQAYQEAGYNFVTVTPLTQELSPYEVNVELRVNEGERVIIDEIEFTGNENYKPGNRWWGLRHHLKGTRTNWWLSWLTGSGKFSQDKFEEAQEKLRRFYEDKGYARVELGEPVMETEEREVGVFKKKVKKFVTITIPIREGDVYRFGAVDIDGNELFSDRELKREVSSAQKTTSLQLEESVFAGAKGRIEPGRTFSASLVDAAAQRILDNYHSRGRIYARIDPLRQIDDETRTVDLTFNIREGIEAFLHRLEFRGHVKTFDKVLRREFNLIEGQSFNGLLFKDGLARLNYLGYLDKIEPDVKPLADPSQVDVEIALDDSRQTEFQISGGYASGDEFYGSLSLAERNLFGRGQELTLTATASSIRETYSVRFSDDYLFDTRNYGSIAVWRSTRAFETSDKDSTGAEITGGRPLARSLFGRLGYSYELIRVYDVDDDASPEVIEAEGRTRTSKVSSALIFDRRNSRRQPTSGVLGLLRGEVAGSFLGGDNIFYKTEAEGSWYLPFYRKTVVALHGEVDYADSWGDHDLPYFERYFLGGPRSLRGFEQNDVGPKDEEGRTIGGNKAVVLNSELVIPLAGPLQVVPFLDAGDVWSASEDYDLRTLRPSVGLELRFYIPTFWVPMRFIWGYNLDRYEGESATEFQFTLGTTF